jgi:hypothetical protein
MELPIIIHIRQNNLEDASLLVLAETRLTPLLLAQCPVLGAISSIQHLGFVITDILYNVSELK